VDRVLPINDRPPLIGKLRHAYPLSILATDDAYLPWFYNNYIQLFCPLARGFPHTQVDFFYPPHYPSTPLLDVQIFDRRVLEKSLRGSIGSFFAHCIDDDLYIRIYVDEFYIGQRAAYQREHFLHKVLLCGYDEGKEIFHIMGFLPNGQYGRSEVGFADLERSFYSDALLGEMRAIDSGERDSALGDFSEIWLAKYRRERRCEFDLPLVVEQLMDYLLSRNTIERFRMLDISHLGQEEIGMGIYRSIQRRLEYALETPFYFDFLSLHTLWEHKKCMLMRMHYMEEQGYLDPVDQYSSEFGEVERQARILRMMMLKARWKNDVDMVRRMMDRIEVMAASERAVLEKVVDRLVSV